MAKVTITIPDDDVDRVTTAFTARYPKPDGITDAEWVKLKIIDLIKNRVLRYERKQAKASVVVDIDVT